MLFVLLLLFLANNHISLKIHEFQIETKRDYFSSFTILPHSE